MLNVNCQSFERGTCLCNHRARKMLGLVRRFCLKESNVFATCPLQEEYPEPKLYKPVLAASRNC